MGGGYSASASSSASAANSNKTSVGPVTFGGVGFGNQGSAGINPMWLILGGVAAAALYFFRK